MTNTLATISVVLVTNWATVSITQPAVSDAEGIRAVVRYGTLNQVGRRVTNTMATVVWKGVTNSMVVESAQEHGNVTMERHVQDNPGPPTLRPIWLGPIDNATRIR